MLGVSGVRSYVLDSSVWTGNVKSWYEEGNNSLVGYYTCTTGSSTAAKTVNDASGYVLSLGGSMKIKFTNKNTASNPTLNINGQGAKSIVYDGSICSSTNTWEAGETVECYYDGSVYQLNNVAGGGNFATGEKVKNVGIDDEPTAGSDNLVKSGGVFSYKVGAEFGGIVGSTGELNNSSLRCRSLPLCFYSVGTIKLKLDIPSTLILNSYYLYNNEIPVQRYVDDFEILNNILSFTSTELFNNIRVSFKHSDNTQITQEEVEACKFYIYYKDAIRKNAEDIKNIKFSSGEKISDVSIKNIPEIGNSSLPTGDGVIHYIENNVAKYIKSSNIHNSLPASTDETEPTDGRDWYGHSLGNTGSITQNLSFNLSGKIPFDYTKSYKSNFDLRRICAYDSSDTKVYSINDNSVAGTEFNFSSVPNANTIRYVRFVYNNIRNTVLPSQVKFGLYNEDIDTDYGEYIYDKFSRRLALKDDIPTPEPPTPQENITKITIQNSDKILIVGSSSVASCYTLPLKSWTNKLNDSLDWIVLTYGMSGKTCAQITASLRSDSALAYADNVKPSEIHPTFVYVGHYMNMAPEAGQLTSDALINENRILIQACKSVFNAQLLIGSDYSANKSYHGEMAMKSLADEFGANYCPIGIYDDNLLRSRDVPAGIWAAYHPGTKSNNFYYQEAYNIFSKLNAPKKSIKLFVPRESLSDYSYKNNEERNEKFVSVESGNYSITNNQEYYDRLNELPANSFYPVTGVYYQLIKKEEVTLENIVLIEAISPVINVDKIRISIVSNEASNLSLKIFDNNSMTFINKTFTVSDTLATFEFNQSNYIDYDKIKILLTGTTAVKINDIYVECYGGYEKTQKILGELNTLSGIQLYEGGNGFDSNWESVWNNEGNCDSYNQTEKYGNGFLDIPAFLPAANKLVVLPYDTEEKRPISMTILGTILNNNIETMQPRKLLVSAYCRAWTSIYNPIAYSEWTGDNNPYTDTPNVTSKSFDYCTISLDVSNQNNKLAVFEKKVGMFWSRVLFEIWVPAFTKDNMTFSFYRKLSDINPNFELQISDVSITRLQ